MHEDDCCCPLETREKGMDAFMVTQARLDALNIAIAHFDLGKKANAVEYMHLAEGIANFLLYGKIAGGK